MQNCHKEQFFAKNSRAHDDYNLQPINTSATSHMFLLSLIQAKTRVTVRDQIKRFLSRPATLL